MSRINTDTSENSRGTIDEQHKEKYKRMAQRSREAGQYDNWRKNLRRAYNLTVGELGFLEAIARLQVNESVDINGTHVHLLEGHKQLEERATCDPERLEEIGLLEKPRVDGEKQSSINKRLYYDLTTEARQLIDTAMYSAENDVIGDLGERIGHAVCVCMAAHYYMAEGYVVERYPTITGHRYDLAVWKTDSKSVLLYLVDAKTSTTGRSSDIRKSWEKMLGPCDDVLNNLSEEGQQEFMQSDAYDISTAKPVFVTPTRKLAIDVVDDLQRMQCVDLKPPQSPHDPTVDGRWEVPQYSIDRLNDIITSNTSSRRLGEVQTLNSMNQKVEQAFPMRVRPDFELNWV